MIETDKVLSAIAAANNGIASAEGIARRLGYRPARKGILGVSAKLRSLHKAGLVGRIPPRDRWDIAMWFVMKEAQPPEEQIDDARE